MLFILFVSVFVAAVSAQSFYISGYDSKCNHVVEADKCTYPDDCYLKMTKLGQIQNVTRIGLIPMGNRVINCDLPDKSSGRIYIVYGANNKCEYVENTSHLVSGLWNSMLWFCSILHSQSVEGIMITAI
jgi:hypothetical protein